MKKLRILLAGHLPPMLGGIAAFCQALLNSSLVNRVDLNFVRTSAQGRPLSSSGKVTGQNIAEAIKDCTRFFGACITHRPGAAHICTGSGLSFMKHSLCVVFAHIVGCRAILHPHFSFVRLCTGISFWRWYCLWVYSLSSVIIVISKEWFALQRHVPKVPIIYLPNAIDIQPFQNIASLRSRVEQQQIQLLYLGYLGEAKGTYDLLEAFNITNVLEYQVVLNLVGDFLTDKDRKRLQDMGSVIDNDKKRIRLLPPVSGEAKMAYFDQADIFIYPSHHEGMPIAIIEAMAAGLPVIATNVGGIPDLIINGVNGLLIPPRATLDLSKAIATLCKDARLRSEFGKKNLLFARDYHIEPYVKKLIDIYTQTICAPRSSLRRRGPGVNTPSS